MKTWEDLLPSSLIQLLESLGPLLAIGWKLVPHHRSLCVAFSVEQLASPSVGVLEKRVSKNTQDARSYELILEVICHHFCFMLFFTQSNPIMWKRTSQGVNMRTWGRLGTISVAVYHIKTFRRNLIALTYENLLAL